MRRFLDITNRLAISLLMIGSMVLFARATGVSSPWFTLTMAFVLLGIIDVGEPYLSIRVPHPLSEIRDWERRGTIYRQLGVIAFGRFLQNSPLRMLNRRVYLAPNSRDLERMLAQIEWAEAAHFWGAIITILYLGVAFYLGWWSSVAALLVFNAAINIYPILHLRWTRARLSRVLSNRHPVPDIEFR